MVALGFAAPLTGPQAIVGVPMCRAGALAVEQHNAGVPTARHVRFVAVNDGATATGAVAAARELLALPDLVGVVGHKNSDCCAAAGAHYAAAGVAQITPSATNSALSAQGWPTFFRVCADNARQAAVACQAIAALGLRHVAVVHDTTAYGQPLAEMVIEGLGAMGMEPAAVLELPAGRADEAQIVAVVDALLAAGADGVYAGLTEVEGAQLVRALRGRGYAPCSTMPVLGAEGGPTSAFLQLAGAAAEGCYHTYAGAGAYPDPSASPAAAPFVQAYEERYGESPSGFAAECYDAAGILLWAIEESRAAGEEPTRPSVLAAVRAMPAYDGATGVVRFDVRTHVSGERCEAAVSLWCVQNGAMRLIGLDDLLPRSPGPGSPANGASDA